MRRKRVGAKVRQEGRESHAADEHREDDAPRRDSHTQENRQTDQTRDRRRFADRAGDRSDKAVEERIPRAFKSLEPFARVRKGRRLGDAVDRCPDFVPRDLTRVRKEKERARDERRV